MKKNKPFGELFYRSLKKILLTMRIAVILMILGILQARANDAYSQKTRLSLNFSETELVKVLDKIEDESEFFFLYNEKLLDTERKVNVTANDQLISVILDDLFAGTDVKYAIIDRKIILAPDYLTSEPQQNRITGTVIDKDGAPIIGANVVVTGTTQGTITDIEGKYSIDVPPGSKSLTFSFIGMAPQEISIGTLTEINLTMAESAIGLEEVVVIGYGTQKKVNLTGSVASVTGESLAKVHVGQTSMALQGIVPGVTITQRSGQPGRDAGSIRIRGIGTLGDSNPFILMDGGVETDINNIDPNDIESISILKDAASSSIYGSRAANGVILITTKRAKTNTFGIDYNTYIGWQAPTDMPKMVNAIDHMELINEAYTNIGRSPLYSDEYINEYKTLGPSDRDKYPNTDWQKLTLTENGFTQSHYLGLNAGGEKVRVFGSFNYLDQGGIIANTNYKRYNFRLNTDMQLNKQFSTSFDLSFLNTILKEPSVVTGTVFAWMHRIPANQSGVLSNGKYGEGWNGNNPIAYAKDGGLNIENEISAILNFTLKYKPTNWLTARLNYAPKYNQPHNKVFYNIIQTYKGDLTPSFSLPAKNSLNESFSRDWYNNLNATITADKTFAHAHQVIILAGLQQEDFENSYITAYREVFLLPEYQMINSGNRLNEQTGGSGSHWALRSLFGRVNYNYKQKYLFEANVRYDGSSRFAAGNNYSVFPSFSAGWRISEEDFMRTLSNTITSLKIRASWGQLGNQNIGLYPYASFVNIGGSNYIYGDAITTGASLDEMANPQIKWETSEVSDFGIDLSLWSKLTITGDYYYRKTSDILLRLDVPTMIGLTAPYQNAGVVENKGWDLSIGYQDKIGLFTYDISANISDVRNKILDMKGVKRTGLTVNLEGESINSIYGYQAIGYFKDAEDVTTSATQFGTVAPGDIKYLDVNDDKVIDNLDQKIIGTTIPRYTYSLNLNLGCKGFDFSMFLQAVGQADGYLSGEGIQSFVIGGTISEEQKDRWTPTNTDAKFPRFAFNEINNEQNSSFWLKNAAYLRLKNIQLGYTLPSNLLKKVSIKNLRVYISGQNLYTFDKFLDGYDVEAPIIGVVDGYYPQLKVYRMGLNVKF